MASARFGLELMGLPYEVEEMILASISNEYIREARSNPLRLALMEELYVWFYCVNLPTRLTTLNCTNNIITNLDNLPTRLDYLNCTNNIITNLDNLPTRLDYLNCTNNTITIPRYFVG